MNTQSAEEAVKQIRHVSRETFERLTIYHDLLVQWQRRINLISPTTIDKIWQRHILDSVQVRKLRDVERYHAAQRQRQVAWVVLF